VNLRGEGPFVFVEDLDAPELTVPDRHHLARVLRLRDGDPLVVSDGIGGWRQATFGSPVALAGPVVNEMAPQPPITMVFAPVKGDRPEWLVQKLTEIGVDRIVPLLAARSVVRWDPRRSGSALERLRRVAREAAMQSRRARLPIIDNPVDFLTAVRWPEACVTSPEGVAPSLEHPTVLVGPEGGWSAEELGAASTVTTLGQQVLRSETAGVVAASLLSALRAGLFP
jgi:16S rRNA (uracil1498-N3)-methyltransferase